MITVLNPVMCLPPLRRIERWVETEIESNTYNRKVTREMEQSWLPADEGSATWD